MSTAPAVPTWSIDRPDLTAGTGWRPFGGFTLVSAPAGYGKSTLVAQWITGLPDDVHSAWVPVDDGRDDRALDAALAEALGSLRSRAGLAVPDVRPALDIRSWLADLPASVVVLDGLGLGTECLPGLAEAVVQSASGLRMVVTSRRRPPRELSRMVLREDVEVLTEDDLRLSRAEVEVLVERILDQPVWAEWLDPVAMRLDGWVAGVVAMAMAWRTAPGDAARTATGFESIYDYLEDQVLSVMDPDVLALLSDTVHLPRLTARLCDEVTGRTGSQEILNRFRDSGGLRASPGTDHAGFGVHELLRTTVAERVAETEPGRREAVANEAVDWYRNHGEPLAAVALLVRDRRWDVLEELVRASLFEVLGRNQTSELTAVLATVPTEVMAKQGSFIVGLAALELMAGNANRAWELLVVGDQWMTPAARMVADLLRVRAAAHDVNPLSAIAAGEAALAGCESLGPDHKFSDYHGPSTTATYEALAAGHLLLAGVLAGEWKRVARHAKAVPTSVAVTMASVADVMTNGQRALHAAWSGHALDGEHKADAALAAATPADQMVDQNLAAALLARGVARRLQGRPAEAVADLEGARERAERNQRRNLAALAVGALAHALIDGGDVAGARDLLHVFGPYKGEGAVTAVGSLLAAQGRVLALSGDAAGALIILGEAQTTSEVSMAAVAAALASGDRQLGRSLVKDWPDEPTVVGQIRRSVATAAVLADTDGPVASQLLDRMLELAAPHMLAQPFFELGPHLRGLLATAATDAKPKAAALARTVLAELPVPVLTPAEVEVLNLLAQGATMRAIADTLNVSVHAIKSRSRSAYRKLGARNRHEAVEAWQRFSS